MIPPDSLSQALGDLSRILFSEESLQSTLKRIVTIVADAIPGCDYAGITEVRDGRLMTGEVTDEVVRRIDKYQYETDTGPCLDAIRLREMQSLDSFETDLRWPDFREKAKGTIQSVLALPLLVDHAVGSINLYAKHPHAFTDVDRSLLSLYSAQASVAVANAVTFDDRLRVAEQLTEAIQSRAVIDQAKGILMDRHRVGADAAFDMLRKASQDLNRKVRDIAQALVDSITKDPPSAG